MDEEQIENLKNISLEPIEEEEKKDYLDVTEKKWEFQKRARETFIEKKWGILEMATGTGKTRVLTTRIAHLLSSGVTNPWSIMAVTFTNKAAREMKERVSGIIGRSAEQVLMGTFHSIGSKFLRQHAELVGLKSNFSIIDVDDQINAIKQISKDLNIDEKLYPPRLFARIINHWKDKGLIPENISEFEKNRFENKFAKNVYINYQKKLKLSNSVDFGDLLLHPL